VAGVSVGTNRGATPARRRTTGLLERLRLALVPPVLIPALALSLIVGLALFFALESRHDEHRAFRQKYTTAKTWRSSHAAAWRHCRRKPSLAFRHGASSASFESALVCRVAGYAAGGKTDTARQRLVAIATQLGSVPAGLNTLTRVNRRTHTSPRWSRSLPGSPKAARCRAVPDGGQLVNLLLAVAAHDRAMLRVQRRRSCACGRNSNHSACAGAVRNLGALADLLAGSDLPSATTTRPPADSGYSTDTDVTQHI